MEEFYLKLISEGASEIPCFNCSAGLTRVKLNNSEFFIWFFLLVWFNETCSEIIYKYVNNNIALKN